MACMADGRGGESMRSRLFVIGAFASGAAILGLAQCGSAQRPPVAADAVTEGGCALAEKIDTFRLIANPDGTPYVIPCDAGAP